MADLGDLLVLLHGARDRVSTVRVVVRTWRHLRLSHEAMEHGADGGGFFAYGYAEAPPQETIESRTRLWLAPPDCAREEHDDPTGGSLGVRRGGSWWRYDPQNGAMSNEGEPDVGSGIGEGFAWLLDPAGLIGSLDFGEISSGRRAGRNTLLRIEARFQQQPFAISEVLEIAFDEQFDEDTFVFTPPPGEEIRSFAEQFPVRRDLTIEEAVALAPFTVWIPARLPAGWESEIGFAAEQDRPPMAPHVFLHYRAPDGTHRLHIAESPVAGPRDDEAEGPGGPWRETERNQRHIAFREPAESWHSAQARVDLDGTRILIRSDDLTADALTDIAAGLVRAPSEPPRFNA
jgi:hypothetical protein